MSLFLTEFLVYNTFSVELIYKKECSEMVITEDTGIIEAVQTHPEIMEVFFAYGLGCVGCMAAHFETIGQGAGAHGIDVAALIADCNKVIAENAKA